MFPKSCHSGARRAVSSFAMAMALGCGAVVATGLAAPAAHAQENSKGFVTAYTSIMPTKKGEQPDWNAVKGQLGALEAAVGNEQDRYLAGQIYLQAGSNLTDPALQRKGLEMMLASGKVAPEDIGRFQYFVGSIAINEGDYAQARTALQASRDAGFTDEDITGLIGETYMREDNKKQAVTYLLGESRKAAAAGQTVPELWIARALQGAYDSEMNAEAIAAAQMLVERYPTPRNFSSAVQIVNGASQYTPQAQLDLLRLLRLADKLPLRQYFALYIESADPRIMSNEVVDVLAEGLAAGEFSASDTYYTEVKAIADGRTAQDRKDAPELVAEAKTKGDAASALIAGDVNYSIDNFAEAERMYALSVERGGASKDTALTREGIAQVQQGKYAEAVSTFEGVAGERATIAALWKAYAASKANQSPAAAPAPTTAAVPAES